MQCCRPDADEHGYVYANRDKYGDADIYPNDHSYLYSNGDEYGNQYVNADLYSNADNYRNQYINADVYSDEYSNASGGYKRNSYVWKCDRESCSAAVCAECVGGEHCWIACRGTCYYRDTGDIRFDRIWCGFVYDKAYQAGRHERRDHFERCGESCTSGKWFVAVPKS